MLIENAFASDVMVRLSIGLAGGGIVSVAAVRASALSRSGGVAATAVGALAVGAGWSFAFVLIGFFASAIAVSKYRAPLKSALLSAIVAKGGSRDAVQVFANGGLFAAASLWMIVSPNPAALFAAVGALAGASADTWATEIGALSKVEPRSILSGKTVPAGTSGGVTMLGASAALFGAVLIGLLAWLSGMPRDVFVACIIAGLAGAALDSLLGASLQSRRWCDVCNASTERRIHNCGSPTKTASGITWITNDAVNFLCTLASAGIAALWVL